MKRYEPSRTTLAAVIAGVTLFAPVALGGDEPQVEALVTECLEELARQRELDELRAPSAREASRAQLDAERDLVLNRLVKRALLDTEQRWAQSAASPDIVRLGAFQDDGPDESGIVHQASIDHDGDGVTDEGDLARAAQNPIADLISVPFQNNTNFDIGGLNYEQNVLNIQPVIPFHLSEDWNLITRTIIPVIYQPALFDGDDHDFGLGDIQFTAFLAPTKTFGGWLIGAGPVLRFPTATDERLGARKWAVGPSAVVIKIEGPWVIGSLFQQVWSVAGSGDGNVSEFLWQPFINYNIPDGGGWYLTTSPIITANWQADDSDDRWTVPIGGGVGRVFRIGSQPVNCSFQGFYNVEKPDVVGDWTLRFQVQLLFPR